MHSLFIVWSLMLVYPAVRSAGRAWVEELSIAAGLFGLLPVLNALTTDRHLGVTIPAGDWALAGFDLTVLALGTGLAITAVIVHTKMRDTHPVQARAAQAASVRAATVPATPGREGRAS